MYWGHIWSKALIQMKKVSHQDFRCFFDSSVLMLLVLLGNEQTSWMLLWPKLLKSDRNIPGLTSRYSPSRLSLTPLCKLSSPPFCVSTTPAGHRKIKLAILPLFSSCLIFLCIWSLCNSYWKQFISWRHEDEGLCQWTTEVISGFGIVGGTWWEMMISVQLKDSCECQSNRNNLITW